MFYRLFAGLIISLSIPVLSLQAQHRNLRGIIRENGNEEPIPFANCRLLPSGFSFLTDLSGRFQLADSVLSNQALEVRAPGFVTDTIRLTGRRFLDILLQPKSRELQEVVVSGTMNEVVRTESVMPIEVYTPALFRKTWAPTLMESVNMINGVQPQLNCNVCNAGDIHINGLEGPYTMVLIDGMPIVSSLSTVYGLSGIPQSLIKRIEVIKGPASTLYGSEAVAGLINIITRDAGSTPKARLEWSATSIGETNLDFSTRWKQGKNQSYLGLNAFWYGLPKDRNADGFTDLALQQRVSVFNKWDFHTKSGKKASLAVRLFNENRWGGQNNWTPEWRGTDSIYGETIQTQRVEVLGTLPVMALQNIKLDYSYNFHQQNSAYGIQDFFASQHTGFAQLVWNLEKGKWKGVSGLPIRLQHYDDNTPATGSGEINASGIQQKTIVLPGLFSQWEYQWSPRFTALAGLRYDAHPVHGGIWTPRIGFRKALNSSHTLRFSAGSGFRVVQLFAEDHAALTGARTVVLEEALRPEKSWNGNLGYQWDMNHHKGFGVLEVNAFLTRFSNQIQGDFETDPEKIIYSNLSGYGISQGVSVQYQREWGNGFRLLAGATWMDVFRMHKKSGGQYSRQTQLFAPPLSGTFTLSYKIQSLMLDFSGRINGPMKLPVFPNDFRPAWSPVYPLLNFQVSSTFRSGLEWQLGLRNLLNFQPSNPILRPFDPFDKRVNENNPQGYSFDPSYNYAPLQGTTIYGGLRWTMN